MTVPLSAGAYVVRVAIPVAGVLASVLLLAAAAFAMLAGFGSDALHRGLFAAGVLSWMFGIAWGVVVNAKPPPPSSPG